MDSVYYISMYITFAWWIIVNAQLWEIPRSLMLKYNNTHDTLLHITAIITQSYNKLWKKTSLVSCIKAMLTEYIIVYLTIGFQDYNGVYKAEYFY